MALKVIDELSSEAEGRGEIFLAIFSQYFAIFSQYLAIFSQFLAILSQFSARIFPKFRLEA